MRERKKKIKLSFACYLFSNCSYCDSAVHISYLFFSMLLVKCTRTELCWETLILKKIRQNINLHLPYNNLRDSRIFYFQNIKKYGSISDSVIAIGKCYLLNSSHLHSEIC